MASTTLIQEIIRPNTILISMKSKLSGTRPSKEQNWLIGLLILTVFYV